MSVFFQRGTTIGQRVGLSDKDTQKLNKMYCDADSNNFEANDTPAKPKKKKKPKNQPFEGHGIGYHQGKTVVIKLPTSESIKLPDVSTIPSFDYFSNTPQAMPSPEAEVSLYGEVAYPYHAPKHITQHKMQDAVETPDDDAIIMLNMETPQESDEIASLEERNKEIAQWGSPSYSISDAGQNTPTSDQNDESLAEAYERLAKTVKQKVYPESRDYSFKINKDYSQFYDPPEYKGSDTIKDLDERFGKTYNARPHVEARKPIKITKERYQNERDGIELPRHRKEYEDTDSSYRTSLPIRKPYSSYEQTETPKYATLEYLKDRHNYSHLYSPRVNDKQMRQRPHSIFNGELPLTEDTWYKKDSLRHNPAEYNPRSYTDYVTMEHKSNEPVQRPSSAEYDDDSTEPPKKSQAYISGEYYDDDSAESPKKSQEYVSGEYDDENSTESPEKSQPYSLFGAPVPLTNSWYKPNYSNPKEKQSYSEEVSASEEDR